MEKLDLQSPDLTARNIEALAELFPTVVTETRDADGTVRRCVDFDLLRQELSDHVVDGEQERYRLDWPGKRRALLAANAPIRKTLRPVREESVDFDTTKNLFIEGDNLEALKLLQESYLGKVKLIYIDPPYNTGNDYIYNDNFAESSANYLERSGQVDGNGVGLVANTESNGRFHSDWLSMMYPRLKLARSLLSDDGAIFVSIDFNEVSNLRRVMDEVFGEDNFQRQITWRIGWLSGYKTAAPNFIRNHDAILFYCRNREFFTFNKKYIANADFKPLLKDSPALATKLAELGLSRTQQKELLHFVNHENRPERYPIEDTWNSNEYDDLNSIAIVSFSGEKLSKLLGVDEDFKGQKSIKMLQRVFDATADEDDIILDFFAGTGSTAHAVMQHNAEHGGSRRYIMIQYPENTRTGSAAREAGYDNIATLAKERIRRSGQNVEKLPKVGSVDTGFRVLKVDTPTMADVALASEATSQAQLAILTDSVTAERTGEDLLFHVLLDWGLELSLPIARETVAGSELFVVDDGLLIGCFAETVTPEVISEIARRQPERVVFRDSGFATDADRINAQQVFTQLAPRTELRTV